jgi:hypothetical protein
VKLSAADGRHEPSLPAEPVRAPDSIVGAINPCVADDGTRSFGKTAFAFLRPGACFGVKISWLSRTGRCRSLTFTKNTAYFFLKLTGPSRLGYHKPFN